MSEILCLMKNKKTCRIDDHVYHNDNEHSIIITFETNEIVKSLILVGETFGDYDTYTITNAPNLYNYYSSII